jgi:hypothetical protein
MKKHISTAAVVGVLILVLALAPAALAGKGGRGGTQGGGGTTGSGSGCSISPGQVVLDQIWTVSAWGLPTSANMIITFPDGGKSTGPIVVASGGTFTTAGNSNMSAGWGVIPPEQTGSYTYQFVGKVSYSTGTFTKLYGQCSVLVS